MKMTAITISSSHENFKEQKIFFDPDCLKILNSTDNLIEKNILSKISYALLEHRDEILPLYIYRISRAENFTHKIIALDQKLTIHTLIVHLGKSLAESYEIKAHEHSKASTLQFDPEALTFSESETYDLPSFCDLKLECNTGLLCLLDSYEKTLIKEQANNFINGKIFIFFNHNQAPRFELPKINYSTKEAAIYFPCLTQFATEIEGLNLLKKIFNQLEKKLNQHLDKKAQENPEFANAILEFQKNPEFISALSALLAAQKKQIELENILERKISSKFAEYVTLKTKLNHIKSYLAWALHCGIGDYFEHLQHQTANKLSPKITRSSKIDSFNHHFEDFFGVSNDGVVKEVEDVFENLSKISLTEIKDFLNYILSYKFNTSHLWFSSDKQKLLTAKINEASFAPIDQENKNLIALHGLADAPMKAWEKSFYYPRAGFKWSKEIEEIESHIQQIELDIINMLKHDEAFKEIREFNIEDEKKQITTLSDHFENIKKQIQDYKNLLTIQNQAISLFNKSQEYLEVMEPQYKRIIDKFNLLTESHPFDPQPQLHCLKILSDIAEEATFIPIVQAKLKEAKEAFLHIKQIKLQFEKHKIKGLEKASDNLKNDYDIILKHQENFTALEHNLDTNLTELSLQKYQRRTKEITALQTYYESKINTEFNLKNSKRFQKNPVLKVLRAKYDQEKDNILLPLYFDPEKKDAHEEMLAKKVSLMQSYDHLEKYYQEIKLFLHEQMNLHHKKEVHIVDISEPSLSAASSNPLMTNENTKETIEEKFTFENTVPPKSKSKNNNEASRPNFFKRNQKALMIGLAASIVVVSIAAIILTTTGFATGIFATAATGFALTAAVNGTPSLTLSFAALFLTLAGLGLASSCLSSCYKAIKKKLKYPSAPFHLVADKERYTPPKKTISTHSFVNNELSKAPLKEIQVEQDQVAFKTLNSDEIQSKKVTANDTNELAMAPTRNSFR